MDIKQENERASVSRPRALDSCGGLARGPFFCGRIPDFSSGIRGLSIDSSALGRGGRQKVDKKMSDTKVKVAVRVRPMNRRGKCFMSAVPAVLMSRIYSDALAKFGCLRHCCSARLYEPKVGLNRSLKKVSQWGFFYVNFALSASLSQPNFCLRRNRAEHEMCGGHGGQPDGAAPSAFQCKRREQVNRTETLPRRLETESSCHSGAISPL